MTPIEQQLRSRLAVFGEDIARFCKRWYIVEMPAFGSALRSDFPSDSDIDVMIEFAAGKLPGLAYVSMANEFETIIGRPVDVVPRFAVERSKNPFRRQEIFETAKVIHVG